MEPLIPSLQTLSLAREGLSSIWAASSELSAPGRGSIMCVGGEGFLFFLFQSCSASLLFLAYKTPGSVAFALEHRTVLSYLSQLTDL